ncbi:WEB family protein At2g38370 [Impatiens glandulifera]|uniref:WEB family protein At2g38370 n=1 Tax=Impatiens glandulifera TaxID=253017 RepID=UPI001FB08F20|nr:WEB family protein At2g38370 [Impatiens glandulifera]
MAEDGFFTPLDLPVLTNHPSSAAVDNNDTFPPAKMQNVDTPRAEIDTSAPFESVKEAATRFGGIGFWKPSLKPSQSTTHQQDDDEEEVIDITEVKEHALLLEKDLIVKERETLDVLKELESTKNMVEELKRKLQKETSEKENIHIDPILCPSSAPGFILMELKQAKLNLSRTTTDLAEIRSIVETYNKRITEEKISLEKTRKRLSANTSRISSMEEELTITNSKLKYINATDLFNALKQLNSEAEEYKKTGEAAKAQVFASLSEIKQTKTKIKTAESRLYAAKKMKDAARATEAVAMAEIKEFLSSSTSSERLSLVLKEEEVSKKRVEEVMVMVEKENLSQNSILEKIEKANEEVKSSKRVLEEALNRVESANIEKLGVEEALRKWRSDHKKRLSSSSSVQNNTKFKNATYPSQGLRKDPRLLDVNGMNMVNDDDDDEPRPVCRPTMSIGQILSRKLEYDNTGEKSTCVKKKVSLGQMLSKPAASSDVLSGRRSEKENGLPAAKRKKFGFGRFSVLVRKQNKRKKKISSKQKE